MQLAGKASSLELCTLQHSLMCFLVTDLEDIPGQVDVVRTQIEITESAIDGPVNFVGILLVSL